MADSGEMKIAVLPLVSRVQDEDSNWIGALLGRLLGQFLEAAGLDVVPYNETVDHLQSGKYSLPIPEKDVERLGLGLSVHAFVHGRYILDEEGKLLGMQLFIEATNIPRLPLEVASPLAGFSRFVERIALAILDQLAYEIDGDLRQAIQDVPRPASFESLRQYARAHAAWARGQNELALAALESALELDPNFEEAAAVEVAVSRVAGDTNTTQTAFRRWVGLARKRGATIEEGERLVMLGQWLVNHGEWDSARKAYQDARTAFKRAGSERHETQVQNNLTNLELVRGKTGASIGAYRRSLRLFEDDPAARRDMAYTLYNLALAHKSQGQREEAERALAQAMQGAQRLKDMRLQGLCMAQRGALYDDAGEWAQARTAYDQANRLLASVGDETNRAIVQSHQALLLKQQGAYEQAERMMLDALAVFEDQGDLHEQAVLWLNLGDLYLAMGLFDQAWEQAERAQDVFERLNSDWKDIAGDLIDTLDNLPAEDEEDMEGLLDMSNLPGIGLNPGPGGPRSPGQPGPSSMPSSAPPSDGQEDDNDLSPRSSDAAPPLSDDSPL